MTEQQKWEHQNDTPTASTTRTPPTTSPTPCKNLSLQQAPQPCYAQVNDRDGTTNVGAPERHTNSLNLSHRGRLQHTVRTFPYNNRLSCVTPRKTTLAKETKATRAYEALRASYREHAVWTSKQRGGTTKVSAAERDTNSHNNAYPTEDVSNPSETTFLYHERLTRTCAARRSYAPR